MRRVVRTKDGGVAAAAPSAVPAPAKPRKRTPLPKPKTTAPADGWASLLTDGRTLCKGCGVPTYAPETGYCLWCR